MALLPSEDEGKLRGRREGLDLRHMQSAVAERGIAQPKPKLESGGDILLRVEIRIIVWRKVGKGDTYCIKVPVIDVQTFGVWYLQRVCPVGFCPAAGSISWAP